MHFNLDHWSSVRDHTERKEVCRIMCGRGAHWGSLGLTGAHLHSLRLILVVGGRRNILINKDCYSANETTNQAVGSSNLSGCAIIINKIDCLAAR